MFAESVADQTASDESAIDIPTAGDYIEDESQEQDLETTERLHHVETQSFFYLDINWKTKAYHNLFNQRLRPKFLTVTLFIFSVTEPFTIVIRNIF